MYLSISLNPPPPPFLSSPPPPPLSFLSFSLSLYVCVSLSFLSLFVPLTLSSLCPSILYFFQFCLSISILPHYCFFFFSVSVPCCCLLQYTHTYNYIQYDIYLNVNGFFNIFFFNFFVAFFFPFHSI